MCAVSFRAKLAQTVYDFLDVGKSPRPADCIFVLAGKLERKTYGIRMWHFGYAAQLILSVGGLEWQQFGELGLDSDGGLESMAAQTPAKKGHFLVRLDHNESYCVQLRPGFLELRAEVRGAAKYLRELPVRSLLVVSSPAQLRRVEIVFRRALRKSGIQLTCVAVPEKPSFDSTSVRSGIWSEYRKYLLYRLLPL